MAKKRLHYIGTNIRKARESRRLTLGELAEAADVSESFLGLVERSKSGLSIDSLVKIAKCLKVPTDSLIIDGSDADCPPKEWEASTSKTALITLIANSTEAEVDFMLEFYRLFKKQGFTKAVSPEQDK